MRTDEYGRPDDRTPREIAHDELDREELAEVYEQRGWTR